MGAPNGLSSNDVRCSSCYNTTGPAGEVAAESAFSTLRSRVSAIDATDSKKRSWTSRIPIAFLRPSWNDNCATGPRAVGVVMSVLLVNAPSASKKRRWHHADDLQTDALFGYVHLCGGVQFYACASHIPVSCMKIDDTLCAARQPERC